VIADDGAGDGTGDSDRGLDRHGRRREGLLSASVGLT
jgi:hypothetical protein